MVNQCLCSFMNTVHCKIQCVFLPLFPSCDCYQDYEISCPCKKDSTWNFCWCLIWINYLLYPFSILLLSTATLAYKKNKPLVCPDVQLFCQNKN